MNNQLQALEEVLVHAHRSKVKVMFPNGEVDHPTIIAFQDAYSGKILSHTLAGKDIDTFLRLSFAEFSKKWGLPDRLILCDLHGFRRENHDISCFTDAVSKLGVRLVFTGRHNAKYKNITREFLRTIKRIEKRLELLPE